jgi:polar amino acid transport system ATP-binding protein
MAVSPPSAAPLIAVDRLVKSYDGSPVLNGITISIEKGDLVSIIGPSGCGKSTLLRCLNCLEILDSGTISIAGVTLQRAGKHVKPDGAFYDTAHELRTEVGLVFQSLNLFPHMTVQQNVMLAPMVVKKEPREQAEANAIRLLDKVGLKKYKDRHPYHLSGGQQQRAAIARALAMAPKVMLYDEPTSALDPELVEEVLQVMRDLDQDGMTQVVVTHEMRFARNASDYIMYMEHGEIIEISDEDEIFINPKDERTRRFLKQFVGRDL